MNAVSAEIISPISFTNWTLVGTKLLLELYLFLQLLSLLSAEDVDSLLDVQVVGIEERSGVIVSFEMVLDKRTAPRQEGLQATYRFSIMNNLVTNQVGSYVIRGTSLVVAPVRANLTDVISSLSLKGRVVCFFVIVIHTLIHIYIQYGLKF